MTPPERSVFLDAQGAQSRWNRDRGIVRYTVEHIAGILAAAPQIVQTIGVNPRLPLPDRLDLLFGAELLEWQVAGARPSAGPAAIYHIMSPFEPGVPFEELWPGWARAVGTRTVVTLFDLIPLIFAQQYLYLPTWRVTYTARLDLIRSADQILAISETTAADAVTRLNIDERRITVIDAGVNDRFAGAYTDQAAARTVLATRLPKVRPGFMLYVGGIDFRKNIERLIEAYALLSPALRARHQLVIVCRVSPADRERLEQLGRARELSRDELVLTGFVPDAELAALYHLCELFVFPSLYEGSGLPILEAMACDAPVAASRTSTSPEILGDTEATFDPCDVRDIARVLAGTIQNPEALERLRHRSRRRVGRHTWDHVVKRTMVGYDAALRDTRRRERRRPMRPRIAWYTPWPPERSGIASYSRRLLRSLGRHADVDVVVAEPTQRYPTPVEKGIRLVHVDDIEWMSDLRCYDRHVFCMGNSHFNNHVYEALVARPGVVLAHDVRLVGFYGWRALEVDPADPHGHLADRIEEMYGERVDVEAFRARLPTREEVDQQNIFMSQEIQRHSELLVVHSRYAADILRLDRPLERRQHAPIEVLPLAVDRRPEPMRPAAERDPLVVSLGILAEIKGLGVLLDAFAIVAERRPDARLCIAGAALPDEFQRWRSRVRDAGLEDRVEIPGFLSANAYDDLLARAAVAVQLRLTSNGEASAAVADALGAGLPTIATAHGWASELPADALVRVPRDIAPLALANEIEALLDDDGRRSVLSSRARGYAAATSYEHVAERYLDLLGLRSTEDH